MSCIHQLAPDTCSWESESDERIDPLGVMAFDRPDDFSGVELDERLWVEVSLDGHTYTVSVQPASEPSDNPAPSEAMAQAAAENAQWAREMACLACEYESGDGSGQVYDDHLCGVADGQWRRRPPLPTQVLPDKGRPDWCRVEFTGRSAGKTGVETLPPDKMEPQELDITPLEWDEPIELMVTKPESFVRLRWELSESRERRMALVEALRG